MKKRNKKYLYHPEGGPLPDAQCEWPHLLGAEVVTSVDAEEAINDPLCIGIIGRQTGTEQIGTGPIVCLWGLDPNNRRAVHARMDR